MGGPHFVSLPEGHRKALGLRGGETLEVRLDLGTEVRGVKPPVDFVKAPKAVPSPWERWESYTERHQ